MTPGTATLHLATLKPCIPVVKTLVEDLLALSSAWAQAGGFSETVAGLVTYLLPGLTRRHFLLHPSPFIQGLADAPRSRYSTSAAEKAAARDRMELYLGEGVWVGGWCGQDRNPARSGQVRARDLMHHDMCQVMQWVNMICGQGSGC
jgi:hypothetical protein